MFSRQPQPRPGRFKCDIVTLRYVFTGELDAGGPLLRHLADSNRAGVRMTNVMATLLDASASALSTFSQDEMIILKDYTVLVRFDSPAPLGSKFIFPEQEKLLVYTERFVIQGLFQSSSERNRLLDIEGPAGRWAVATDAILHPLLPTTKSAPATARVMLLNKTAIQFFHPSRG